MSSKNLSLDSLAAGSTTDEGEDDWDESLFSQASADEFMSLISFENLENVIKHVIRKFQTLETYNSSIDATLQGLRSELERRVEKQWMDDIVSELRSKCDNLQNSLHTQNDMVKFLETQQENIRVNFINVERKIESLNQEKTVQDRLIRETQDQLTDKVAVTELNLFDAKFAGYTTKLEYQELLRSFQHYTRSEVTERLAESVRILGVQFEDYTRTSRIDQQLKEMYDWVNDELSGYAKASFTTQKAEELSMMIRDQSRSFERVHSMADDKLRAVSDRVTSIYEELHVDVANKAPLEDIVALRAELHKYALREDTETFSQDCGPKLKYCVDSIRAFEERLNAQDKSIERVDEVLLDKAAKFDIRTLGARIDQCLPLEKAEKDFARFYEQISWMNAKVEQYIDREAERLAQFKPPDYSEVFEQIQESLLLKADRADLQELNSLKANRIDADELSRMQEQVHRQLEYLAVTTNGLAKCTLMEPKKGESGMLRTQQKSQVLMQSEALWHWIIHNETPPNIDTLKPPGAQKQEKSPKQAAHDESDKHALEKRNMDDKRRMLLEKKLGVTAEVW